jgi:hypothetical protein
MKIIVATVRTDGSPAWPTFGTCTVATACPEGYAGSFHHDKVVEILDVASHKTPEVCVPCEATNCKTCKGVSAIDYHNVCSECKTGYTLK